MDIAYCLRCDTFISNDSDAAYCSQHCFDLDHPHSAAFRPVPAIARPPSPSSIPPRPRITQTRSIGARWMGKDRQGILNWAHSVKASEDGHDEIQYDTDDEGLHTLFPRAPIFPLSAQILAPPTLSTIQDDSISLVTPCTEESIVTPPSALAASVHIVESTTKLGPIKTALRWFAATSKAPLARPVLERDTCSSTEYTAADMDTLMPVGVDAYTFANEKEKRKAGPHAFYYPGPCGAPVAVRTIKSMWIPPTPPSLRNRDWGGRWDDELLLEGLHVDDLPEQVVDDDEEDDEESFFEKNSFRGQTETVQRGRTLSRHSRDRGHERLVYGVAVE